MDQFPPASARPTGATRWSLDRSPRFGTGSFCSLPGVATTVSDLTETASTPTRASPWPPLIAVGLAVAEFGVLFGVFAVAVGGVCCFGGSVAGLVADSGYANSRARALVGVALVLGGAGAPVVALTSYQVRGLAVLGGAGVLVALAAIDRVRARPSPVG